MIAAPVSIKDTGSVTSPRAARIRTMDPIWKMRQHVAISVLRTAEGREAARDRARVVVPVRLPNRRDVDNATLGRHMSRQGCDVTWLHEVHVCRIAGPFLNHLLDNQ